MRTGDAAGGVELGSENREGIAGAVEERDGGAFGGEETGDAGADAAGGSGDDGDVAWDFVQGEAGEFKRKMP